MSLPRRAEDRSLEQRHRQYLRQAEWTAPTRNVLYRRAGLFNARAVLDVGCGTGVLTNDLAARARGQVVGLDFDQSALSTAAARGTEARYVLGDAHETPFPDGTFDIVHCHFLFLWVADPVAVVREMWRVCRGGGHLLACAEPDYGGRIDYPEDVRLGYLQRRRLEEEGADPEMGRKLLAVFVSAGMQADVGVIASTWSAARYLRELEAEWDTVGGASGVRLSSDAYAEYKAADIAAGQSGKRFSFMPLVYAVATKK